MLDRCRVRGYRRTTCLPGVWPADVVSARPETPSDVIADELCSSMVEASLPQRRAVQLAVDFGLEFNAQMLQRLLNQMS